jgi:ATP-dependent exoDNAse (exonuclease V) beta subunit
LVGDLSKQDVKALIKKIEQEAPAVLAAPAMAEATLERFKEIIQNKDLRPYLYVDGAQVYCEKEVVDGRGITKRLDRLIVREKEIVIVDYKSSNEGSEEYRTQVNEYRMILSKIYKGRKITCYLVYLDTMKIDEV